MGQPSPPPGSVPFAPCGFSPHPTPPRPSPHLHVIQVASCRRRAQAGRQRGIFSQVALPAQRAQRREHKTLLVGVQQRARAAAQLQRWGREEGRHAWAAGELGITVHGLSSEPFGHPTKLHGQSVTSAPLAEARRSDNSTGTAC